MNANEPEDLNRALAGIRMALEADGYDLHADLADGVHVVSIEAGPGACEECLVPKELMLDMIRAAAGLSPAEPVVLRFPGEV
jgi:hypothetical protein